MEQLLSATPGPRSIEEHLNEHLGTAEAHARADFGGPITYGAGFWERVHWSDVFDLVGLDVYLRPVEATSIVTHLQGFHHFGKPVVATEFGCVTNILGAREYGADVVDWTTMPPSIVGSVTRDEEVQARSIGTHLRAFDAAAIHGAFCFVFIEPTYVHDEAPVLDLDIASFGVVAAVESDDPSDPNRALGWQRKRAFHELATLYADTDIDATGPTTT
jgi:hypothetical protein